jgi:hypothetical protein
VRAASGRWDESTTVVMKVAERLLLRETVNDAPALAAYREHFADAWARYGPTLWAASAPAAGALVLPVFDEQLWAETQLCMVRGNGLINADLFAPGADPGWLGCAPMSTVMLSPQVAAAAVAAHRRGRLEPVLAHELIHTPQQGRQERHEKEAVTETTTRELLPAGDYIPQSYLWEVAAFDGIAAVCGLPARTLALGAQRRMVAGEDGALAAELAASWPAAAALSDRQIQDALDGAFVSDPRPSPADASARARAYFKRATMFATNDLA